MIVKILLVVFVVAMVAFAILVIVGEFYLEPKYDLQQKDVEVVAGPHVGRDGRVVDFPWMYNMWHYSTVCINIAANEEEKQRMIQQALDRDVGWKLPEDAEHENRYNLIDSKTGKRKG